MDDKLHKIPTNIITGFLGSGKTTAIVHLLAQKPPGERWAVLVNEFGEVGIDGALFAASHAQSISQSDAQGSEKQQPQEVFIREVPGGCMCCAAGLPMQMALNMLLARAKPDRLLIEPTGLGHPKEVMQVLSNEFYEEVLDLQQTLTLIDARHIADKRYTEHETFNQQLEIADVIVANKVELSTEQDLVGLHEYLQQKNYPASDHIIPVSYGQIALSLLDNPVSASDMSLVNTQVQSSACNHEDHEHHHEHKQHHTDQHRLKRDDETALYDLPESGYIRVDNQGEGYFSAGWVFSTDFYFNAEKLQELLDEVPVQRIKAVVKTFRGWQSFNRDSDQLSIATLGTLETLPLSQSKLEVISIEQKTIEQLAEKLMTCIVSDH